MRIDTILLAMTGAAAVEGGVSAVNLNLIEALRHLSRERRLNLKVFSYREGDDNRPDSLPPGSVFRGYSMNKARFAADLWRAYSPSTLYVVDYVRLARPILPLALAGRLRNVIFAHGWDYWKRLKKPDAWLLRSASLCLANSDFTLRKMRERLPDLNARVCALGLSPRFPLNRELRAAKSSALQLTSANGTVHRLGNRMLLLTARMEPGERQKGHHRLLKALPLLIPDYPDLQIVFVGPGSDRHNLERAAAGAGLSDRVFMPGHLPVKSLLELYQSCYAYVMPSTQEGFGLAYLEAMNWGKPCIGCRDQGAEDVIVDGVTGYLLREADNVQELAAALRRLFDSPELARSMGQEGFKRLHRHFTSEQFQKRFRDSITPLL